MQVLREPALAQLDLDGADRLQAHRAILDGKPMLRAVFEEMHALFLELDRRHLSGAGLSVELGAGVFPIRESRRDVLATDVVSSPHLDCVVDACAMPFADGAVRAIFGQNAFHHFPRPRRFFAELTRVLAPGGGAILLEPYHGWLASWLYPRLFASEGFDKCYPDWDVPATGPMNGANQALSYITFERDRERFEAEFPALRLVHSEPVTNYVRYLLSGGLNFRQLVPGWTVPVLRAVERLLRPASSALALHHVIVLVRER
jgi:SAM-dependent methyltransferase